jgi:hypothetical protein
MTRLLTLLATFAVATLLAVGAVGTPTPRLTVQPAAKPPDKPPDKGPLGLTTTADGRAVITASRMRPGSEARAELTVTNTGSVTSEVRVSVDGLVDTPGRLGGRLSPVLQLEVLDLGGRTPTSLLRTSLATRPAVVVGSLKKNEQRRYAVVLRFPNGGRPPSPTTGDNLLQAAASRFDLTWSVQKDVGTSG